VAPISHHVADYAGEVMDCLDAAGLRLVLCDGRETLARRIVAAREAKVPVVAVLGRREAEARSVTLRERDGAQSSIPLGQVGQVLAIRR
jgi:threonyl-tRNA synthetase